MRGRVAAFLRAATRSLPADELRAHAASHVDLVDAIAGGDPGQAQAEMARHIEVAAPGSSARWPAAEVQPVSALVVVTDSDLPSDGAEERLLGEAGVQCAHGRTAAASRT